MKLALILFMITTALAAFDAQNLQPFIPEDDPQLEIWMIVPVIDGEFGIHGFQMVYLSLFPLNSFKTARWLRILDSLYSPIYLGGLYQ